MSEPETAQVEPLRPGVQAKAARPMRAVDRARDGELMNPNSENQQRSMSTSVLNAQKATLLYCS
ncbi:MAG: hypothetical protein ACKOU6_09865, partial [Planctomycetota bacterium]